MTRPHIGTPEGISQIIYLRGRQRKKYTRRFFIMLEFLNGAIKERALAARNEQYHTCTAEYALLDEKFRNFDKRLPPNMRDRLVDCLNKQTDLEVLESEASYRAGFYDGVALGVMAASASKR
jgi:hypothetical protein